MKKIRLTIEVTAQSNLAAITLASVLLELINKFPSNTRKYTHASHLGTASAKLEETEEPLDD